MDKDLNLNPLRRASRSRNIERRRCRRVSPDLLPVRPAHTPRCCSPRRHPGVPPAHRRGGAAYRGALWLWRLPRPHRLLNRAAWSSRAAAGPSSRLGRRPEFIRLTRSCIPGDGHEFGQVRLGTQHAGTGPIESGKQVPGEPHACAGVSPAETIGPANQVERYRISSVGRKVFQRVTHAT